MVSKIKKLDSIIATAEKEGRDSLMEHEVYDFLDIIGISSPKHDLVRKETDIDDVLFENYGKFGNYGSKIVLKVCSPDIMHKTDVGGVHVIENNPYQVMKAYREIMESVPAKVPDARIDGVLFSEYLDIDKEILVSMIRDEQFGHMMCFGLGGVVTELYKDIALRIAPASKKEIQSMMQEINAYPLLAGYRGRQGVDTKSLIDAAYKIGCLANHFSEGGKSDYIIEELEINPFAASASGVVAVDGLLKFSKKEKMVYSLGLDSAPNTKHLDNFFRAESVAVVGATEGVTKLGHDKPGKSILKNMLKSDIERIYPINPKSETVMGVKCYKSLKELPEVPDLAVVAIPAKFVPYAVKDAAEKGIKAMVIVTSGFSEIGSEGKKLEQEMMKAAQEIDDPVRILGPNCMGCYSIDNMINTFFIPEETVSIPKTDRNNVAYIAQSGSIGTYAMQNIPKVGVKYFVSLGNQRDVDIADLIAHFDKDAGISVMSVYMEGVNDGRKFYTAASGSKTPIVILKSGKSKAGSKATSSHTGSIAGDYKAYQTAFRQAGLIEAQNSTQFYNYTKMFSHLDDKKVGGNRIALLSNAGAMMVLGSDQAMHTCLEIAPYSKRTTEELSKILDSYVTVQNPTDVGGVMTDADFAKCFDIIMADENIDAVVMHPGIEPPTMDGDKLVKMIADCYKKYDKPVVISMPLNKNTYHLVDYLEENKIPCFINPEEAVDALGAYVNFWNK